ncbi:MAG: hypothetical protein FWD61_03410 [Phycisphaerales bacterium]|nr:hypothetical protein [Phycisphaerales bacterium]
MTEETTITETIEEPSLELEGQFGKVGPRSTVTHNHTHTHTTKTVKVTFDGRLTKPNQSPPSSQDDSSLWIVQGDDYCDDHKRAIIFTTTELPDGATYTLEFIACVDGSVPIVAQGTIDEIPSSPGHTSHNTITFELTSDMTSRLFVGDAAYTYKLRADVEGHRISLLEGSVTVTE